MILWAVGCGGDATQQIDTHPDAPSVDTPPTLDVCSGPGRDKIMFTRAESCANDGGVEWCIPDSDSQLRDTLAAISPTISCAPGGGRAGCYDPPGLLLCSYPTAYPGQCLAPHGEMTAEVWGDMCAIAALPQITAIVPTILE